MPYRKMNIAITEVRSSVTEGTIDMIQSANEPVRKQLINRYCGRLSTWETSWFSATKEGQIILEAHDADPGHWLSPAPVLSAFVSVSGKDSSGDLSDKTPDSASDRNSRSVSAINKVLERYNLVRKRRLH